MVDGRDSVWKNKAPGPHGHRNTARQAMDGLWPVETTSTS